MSLTHPLTHPLIHLLTHSFPHSHSLILAHSDGEDWDDEVSDLRDPDQPPSHEYNPAPVAPPTPTTLTATSVPLPACPPLTGQVTESKTAPPPPPAPVKKKSRVAARPLSLSEQLQRMKLKLKSRRPVKKQRALAPRRNVGQNRKQLRKVCWFRKQINLTPTFK